jgi:hypothetical protein
MGFRMMGLHTPQYSCGGANPTATPNAPPEGIEGNPVFIGGKFDGWGYMHLYRNDGPDLTAVDHFAIAEAMDEDFAFDFGDLSVHEFATDPQVNLAYSSYYAGGLRVMRFGDTGLQEAGKFIDQGGNNFWGVEAVNHPAAGRLIALSDRDFGLYLARYTGTGGPPAAAAPTCASASRSPGPISLQCTDPNLNALTFLITKTPANGTLSGFDPETGRVTYTPRAGFSGTDTFSFEATDGHFDSNVATITVTVPAPQADPGGSGAPDSPAPQATPQQPVLPSNTGPVVRAGACANDIIGTAARDLLRGTAAGERMIGGRGNDKLSGAGGDDCLFGDAGNDELSGDDGDDDVVGGAGRDKLTGGLGDDELDGGAGDDTVDGGAGNDRVAGGSGDDRMVGGAGRDNLRGGAGADRISARGGGRDRIDCGSGRDRVTADRTDKVARNCEVVRRR